MLKPLHNQRGLSLLEILVILVVVTIVAVLIIPMATSGPAKSRDQQRKADLLAIQQGLNSYYSTNNSYPGTKTWISDLTTGPTPVLAKVPTDPKTHKPYDYAPIPTGCTTGACTSYTLSTKMEIAGDAKPNPDGVYELMSSY